MTRIKEIEKRFKSGVLYNFENSDDTIGYLLDRIKVLEMELAEKKCAVKDKQDTIDMIMRGLNK